jgi:regulator of protease activity HflC (stomatin/prohibitin superfamily)
MLIIVLSFYHQNLRNILKKQANQNMPTQAQETTESSIVLNLKPVADTLGYQILSVEIPSVVVPATKG